jgi:hypothetical protein
MSKAAPIREDYLDEDPEISGQKYALLSFISPENVLQSKDQFFFERFLKHYEIQWKVKNLEQFLASTVTEINDKLSLHVKELEKVGQQDAADICRKSYIKVDEVLGKYQGFVAKNQKEISKVKLADDYKDFMFKEQTKLDDEFHSENDFKTTVRGVKVRGVVRDEREAQLRVKKLQANDRIHNIFMAEVGKWTPWDPSPHQVQDQEYAQEELNTLMKKYKENEQSKDQFFEEQKKNKRAPGDPAKFGAADKVIEVISDDATAVEGAAVVAAAGGAGNAVMGGSSNYAGLFDAPGDLAIARKMER